jgi:hypothetical protein
MDKRVVSLNTKPEKVGTAEHVAVHLGKVATGVA